MCRIACFPPKFDRAEAIAILKNFEKGNVDGTGYAYIKDGNFVVEKSPESLSTLLKKDESKFLAHMPNDSWTIVHLRMKSHGVVCLNNTHPFIIEDKFAFIHNGIFSEYSVAKLAMPQAKIEGDTDTEVAGHLLNIAGQEKFMKGVSSSGVFVALHKDGKLDVIKTSGDLEIYNWKESHTFLIASELNKDYKSVIGIIGWYSYNPDGTFNKCVPKYESITTSTSHYSSNVPVTSMRNLMPHEYLNELQGISPVAWAEMSKNQRKKFFKKMRKMQRQYRKQATKEDVLGTGWPENQTPEHYRSCCS